MDKFDLAFIGSGIASTLTIIELLKKLLADTNTGEPLSIAVIEKHPEFWTGIPYGSRSSVNALTITCVDDFIHDNEKTAFFAWLKQDLKSWTDYYLQQGAETARIWLDRNLAAILNDDWKAVYIPRFLYGKYLLMQLQGLLDAASQKEVIRLVTVQAEAIAVRKDDATYQVDLEVENAGITTISTRKLIISTGSAPCRNLTDILGGDSPCTTVNNIYVPSVKHNFDIIEKTVNAKGPALANVLIVGSNASSIELLYLLANNERLLEKINRIVMISPSGMLPYHISTEQVAEQATPQLDRLKAAGNCSIEQLVEGAAADLKLALKDGANVDYIATIISTALTLMQDMDESAKKKFFGIYGMQLSNLFRRSGPEYKNAEKLLREADKLTMVTGRFNGLTAASASYLDMNNVLQQFPENFDVVINCTGSNNLKQASCRLFDSLINNGLCEPNLSEKGFKVNERFEAAPNLYIMGPLLGGNMNKLIHFWHLENASRLTYLAPYLAEELVS